MGLKRRKKAKRGAYKVARPKSGSSLKPQPQSSPKKPARRNPGGANSPKKKEKKPKIREASSTSTRVRRARTRPATGSHPRQISIPGYTDKVSGNSIREVVGPKGNPHARKELEEARRSRPKKPAPTRTTGDVMGREGDDYARKELRKRESLRKPNAQVSVPGQRTFKEGNLTGRLMRHKGGRKGLTILCNKLKAEACQLS